MKTTIKMCTLCDRKVQPVKKFSVPAFLGWACLFGVGAIVYLVYYAVLKKKNACPICGNNCLLPVVPLKPKKAEVIQTYEPSGDKITFPESSWDDTKIEVFSVKQIEEPKVN